MDMSIIAGARLRTKVNLLLTTNSTSSTWEMNSALFNHDVDYQYVDNTNGNVLYSGSAADLGFAVDLSIGNGNTSLFILDRASGYDIDELDIRALEINTININFLPSLLRANFSANGISVLDVKQNTALTDLIFSANQVEEIDVTQNTALTNLTFRNNNISELDVTQNTALEVLTFNDNTISVLDASQNTALTGLLCRNNTLTSLNIKNGNNRNIITIEIDQNPDLECVLVDDVAYANTNFTSKDAQTYYSETECP